MITIKKVLMFVIFFTVQTWASESPVIQELNLVKQSWRSDSLSGNKMSCRFYIKRFESFIQRSTEFHWAIMNEKRKLTYDESLRLKDLAERRNIPLDLNSEDLLWEAVFEIPSKVNSADLQKTDWFTYVDSSQFQLSGIGLPALDEFSIVPYGEHLIVRMRMGYWNACFLKNYLKIHFQNASGLVMKISLNSIESF